MTLLITCRYLSMSISNVPNLSFSFPSECWVSLFIKISLESVVDNCLGVALVTEQDLASNAGSSTDSSFTEMISHNFVHVSKVLYLSLCIFLGTLIQNSLFGNNTTAKKKHEKIVIFLAGKDLATWIKYPL